MPTGFPAWRRTALLVVLVLGWATAAARADDGATRDALLATYAEAYGVPLEQAASAYADIARAQAAMGDGQASDETLAKAQHIVQSLPDTVDRRDAVWRIALAEIVRGRMMLALPLIDSVDDGVGFYGDPLVVRQVVLARAAAGDVAGALETARHIADVRYLILMAGDLAAQQEAAGDEAGVRAALNFGIAVIDDILGPEATMKVPDRIVLAQALGFMAVYGVVHGRDPGFLEYLRTAVTVAGQHPDPFESAALMAEIALRCQEVGQTEAAYRLIVGALQGAPSVGPQSTMLIAMLNRAQAYIGDVMQAYDTSAKLAGDQTYTAMGFIAEVLAIRGEMLMARSTADYVPEGLEARFYADVAIGQALARAGSLAESRVVMADAIAGMAEDTEHDTFFAAHVASSQSWAGDRDGALATAATIPDPVVRARVLADILSGTTKPGGDLLAFVLLPHWY